MRAAVIVFPGSNCETDCFYALRNVMKFETQFVWHKERQIPKVDLVVLPGGFSYGDYLRTGAIARFSPAMEAVRKHAGQGRAVLGICNGFQILLEAGMLPGAMLRNKTLSFICKDVTLRVETRNSLFTRKMKAGSLLTIPIAHGEGNYTCDDETFKELAGEDRIVFRYAAADGTVNDESNPNGSRDGIAGILNKKRNVLGMMPHPERSSEEILSGVDGRAVWESILAEV